MRRFDYATLGYRKKTDSYAVARSMIVTNKRVIHQDVSEKAGQDLIVRREMPIEHAKFVDVSYSKTSNPSHLVAALIFAILAVGVYFLTNLKAALPNVAFVQKIPDFLFPSLAGVIGLIALISVFRYFGSRRILLACTVSTDSAVQPIFSNTITDEKISPKKAKQANRNALRMELDIRVNKRAAKELADGLGAAILDAIEMNREAEAAERAACAPAPVVMMPAGCCASETAAEPEEEPVEETYDEAEAVEETVEAAEEPADEPVEGESADEVAEEEAAPAEDDENANAN